MYGILYFTKLNQNIFYTELERLETGTLFLLYVSHKHFTNYNINKSFHQFSDLTSKKILLIWKRSKPNTPQKIILSTIAYAIKINIKWGFALSPLLMTIFLQHHRVTKSKMELNNFFVRCWHSRCWDSHKRDVAEFAYKVRRKWIRCSPPLDIKWNIINSLSDKFSIFLSISLTFMYRKEHLFKQPSNDRNDNDDILQNCLCRCGNRELIWL